MSRTVLAKAEELGKMGLAVRVKGVLYHVLRDREKGRRGQQMNHIKGFVK